jgi:hypothetical protein
MTDDQFDELCRSALAFEPGLATAKSWSRIRPSKVNWLPTVPEIFACGCACGLVLVVLGVRLNRNQAVPADSNPVVQKAVGESLRGLQASAFQVPGTASWTQSSLSLRSSSGAALGQSR